MMNGAQKIGYDSVVFLKGNFLNLFFLFVLSFFFFTISFSKAKSIFNFPSPSYSFFWPFCIIGLTKELWFVWREADCHMVFIKLDMEKLSVMAGHK